MKALDILMAEHRRIERALAVLRLAVDRARADGPVELAVFEKSVAFLKRYADDQHHAKEEGILFREMQKGGMPKEGGPLHCMTTEHHTLRKLADLMVASVAELRAGKDEAADVLIEAADGYVRVLSAHIQREDMVLYPLATRVVSAEAFAKMEAEFAQVDAGFSIPMELAANELEAMVWPPSTFQVGPEHVRLTPG